MFVIRKIFMDYVVPDKTGVLFVLPILSQTKQIFASYK